MLGRFPPCLVGFALLGLLQTFLPIFAAGNLGSRHKTQSESRFMQPLMPAPLNFLPPAICGSGEG